MQLTTGELKKALEKVPEDSIILTWYDWISRCYNAECQAPAIIEVNSSMLYDQYDGMTYHFRNKTLAEKYRKLVNKSRGFTNG